MDKKDIYEIFNQVDFETGSYEEVPMNDIEKQKMKNLMKGKVKEKNKTASPEIKRRKLYKEKNRFGYKIVAVVALLIFLMGVTPVGRDVLAAIGDKLFFNPSYGVIDGNKVGEFYTLEEAKRVTIGEDSILIKGIINNGDYISLDMWISEEKPGAIDEEYKENYSQVMDEKIKGFKENLRIQGTNGQILEVDMYSAASGGHYGLSFKQKGETLTEFDLYYGDTKIDSFKLAPGKFVANYDEMGGNATSEGILVGATSYYQEGERYFKLWSNLDMEEFKEYYVTFYGNWSNLEVTDEEGNHVEIEDANDGTGKAFKVLGDYKGRLNIAIKDIEVSYNLHEVDGVSIKIPKDGETLDINKDIKFPGLKDTVVLESIKNVNNEYTMIVDSSKNYDENRKIYMARQRFRSGGSMGDPENLRCEMYLNDEDLSFKERFLNKITYKIDNIDMIINGNWEFIIE